jgi:transcription initiation factor IIE alpha subunit
LQRKQNKTSSIVSPKKKKEKESSPTFYAIPITKEEISLDEQGNASSEIRVEIGKINIYSIWR